MRPTFGLVIPQGWKLDLRSVEGASKKWQRMVEIAQVADATGFDAIWLYDHFETYPTLEEEPAFECWMSLALLATQTRRVRLGPLVTCCSYRQPSLLAKMAATLDVASSGRLEFGIGAGWNEREFASYGYEFPTSHVRLSMLGEAVQLILRMWTPGRATFAGHYYHITDALCEPKPVQLPHPPVIIGGGGERVTLLIAARWGNKCNVSFLSPTGVALKFAALRRRCEEVGRRYEDVRKSVQLNALICTDDNELSALIARYHHMTPLREYYESAIVGTPLQCRERIKAYLDVGVQEFMFYMPQAVNTHTVETFAHDVLASFW